MKKTLIKKTKNIGSILLVFIILLITSSCSGIIPIHYTITSSSEIGGEISPEGLITVNEGKDQTFFIEPFECYQIENVIVDGLSIGIVDSYRFEDIQQDHTIEVHFSLSGSGIYNVDTGNIYNSIQDAINNSLSGETIIICPGTYKENLLISNKNIFLKSSNPLDPVIVDNTIIDGGGNSSVVEFSTNDISVLEGFTIKNGNAEFGGGIAISNSSPTITNNTIINNSAEYDGGGIAISNSSPTITNNTIINNSAEYDGGGINMYNSSPTITNNTIINNSAEYDGGGIALNNSSPIIGYNLITENNGTFGGGIYIYNSFPTIIGNTITNNVVASFAYGGGIFITDNSSPSIGGIDLNDTENYNVICGNDPDQIEPENYPNNSINNYCE